MDQTAKKEFPYKEHKQRLQNYSHYDMLFDGRHFDAFAIKINNQQFTEQYQRLKYVQANFAGLISKVVADMLAGEPISVRVEDKKLQQWLDNFVFENSLHTQLWESAVINSRRGDDLFKVRAGKLHPEDKDNTIIMEQQTAAVYYPKIKNGNYRARPEHQELAWEVEINEEKYVRIERHFPGRIENELWSVKDGKLDNEVSLSLLGDDQPEPSQDTGVSRSLITHIPNWRAGSYFGVSDYHDLESLMFAVNNRMTKNENVLDKHTDPILALPEGVLDEQGNIRQDKLGMFTIPDNEMGAGQPNKPEYITWNANLEASFSQIDKLIEFLYMTSETSPDAFGMGGDGNSAVESGRALKLRLMRTISKVNRKKRYYDQRLKEALLNAQELAISGGYKVMGEKHPGTAEVPQIIWQDGLPIDEIEQIEAENSRIEGGTESTVDAIMRLDDINRDEAAEKAERIKQEQTVQVPSSVRGNFGG